MAGLVYPEEAAQAPASGLALLAVVAAPYPSIRRFSFLMGATNMVSRHCVEVGQVAYISGPRAGKLVAIIAVVDENRALVGGACTQVRRQAMLFKCMQLTDFLLKFPHSACPRGMANKPGRRQPSIQNGQPCNGPRRVKPERGKPK